MPTRTAILTVSDTASADATADRSGPKIKEFLVSQHDFEVQDGHYAIVPDDISRIRAVVQEWCDSEIIDWVITTGGTGFGVRDVTPEAISPLIERPASGLVHLMLSSSLQHTPLAGLSRPVAGTIKKTLITTLPGSVKAVTENLQALLGAGVVQHAIELIRGGSGQRVHASLTASSPESHSCHHHHHHHHHHSSGHQTPKPRSTTALSHDPSAPASTRHRQSPYPQISLENALNIMLEIIQELPVEAVLVGPKLSGYVLAEDVHAPMDVPTRPTTSVDGYALRSTDPPGIYKVVTSQTHPLSNVLPEGSIYRINTGGPLPLGANAIIMVEDTRLVSTYEKSTASFQAGEEKEVETLAQVPPGENVRAAGSDVKKDELVMQSGEIILKSGGEIGTLAFVGRKEVKVFKKPVVALLSTGNEIVDLHSADSSQDLGSDTWGGIFDTNRPTLHAALSGLGYEVVDLGIVPDDIPSHLEALKKGLKEADLVLTTGGTSMGPTDLLKPIIERYLDGTVHFGRVSVKPGKPTTFATVPCTEGTRTILKPIFALPGNPASAMVTFYVFVLPALRKMGGWPKNMRSLPRVAVQIQNAMNLDPRVEFHRVVIRGNNGNSDGALKAYSTGGQRSSRAGSLCGSNGLVVLPPLAAAGPDGVRKTRLEVGEYIQAMLIGEIEMP